MAYQLILCLICGSVLVLVELALVITILQELKEIGYHCHHRVLSYRNVVPQDRHRLP